MSVRIDPMAAARAVTLVRIATATLLFAHGAARLAVGGVVPFGGWLESQGLPFGVLIAGGITVFEILAPPVWASGRWVRPLVGGHAVILLGGLLMVHATEGWFVVGLGRNGMEYSVLLLICLAAVAWAAPRAGSTD